jgi:hypothetical protein
MRLAAFFTPATARAGRGRPGGDASRRLAGWARGVRVRLRETGLRVQVRVSDERAVFARAGVDIDDARVRLALAIEAQSIEATLEIPAGHLRAARTWLADPERALQLTAALEALPEQFAMGVVGEGARSIASVASADDMRALIDRAEQQRRAFSLGWSLTRDVALQHADVLDEQLEDAIVALGEVFALLADSGGPAGSALRSGKSGGRDPAHGRHVSGSAGAWSNRRGGDDDRKGPRRRALAVHREQWRDRDREREAEPEPETAREGEPVARGPRLTGPRPVRAGLRRRTAGEVRTADDKIDKGARVRVLEGPFAGKVGVVQELDGKGGARVMLGLLAVRLAVKDLAISIERRNRPLLSSSHRKPLPVRS